MNDTSLSTEASYVHALQNFDINEAGNRLHGDLEKGLNACVECCDRYVGENRIALRWVAEDGHIESYTYEQMQDMSARAAEMLSAQGVVAGDVVAGMLPRIPELLGIILGTWRLGGIYQPLFTAFGSKAIEHRFNTAATKFVVTNTANRPKLNDVPNSPKIATIVTAPNELVEGDLDFHVTLAAQTGHFEPVMRKGSDHMMMMSTSGTTGAPKGVPVPLFALVSFEAYMRDAVDLKESDVFWNIADPGWAYGLYYAVAGPLMIGCATLFNEGAFTAKSTYDTIERLGVTSLAGSPTAFRLLIAAGDDAAVKIKGKLRIVSSAGEPLNPEVIRWFGESLEAPIYDHYGQTETGMIVNNHHGLKHPIRQGSAGFAMPGYRVAVINDKDEELEANIMGELAVDIAQSPMMWFDGYWGKDTPAIANGYYRTGDTVEKEVDGAISFVGRADDVITSSGYRIGPFDVESALLEHPGVVETAVVGVPDPQRTEIVKAFVILGDDAQGSDELAEELRLLVKNRLSAHAYPREIEFMDALPKTPSGKIQRFMLRDSEINKIK